MSKKVAILAKLENFVSVEGLIPADKLAEALAKALAEKTLRALPLSAFEGVDPAVLAFAEKHSLVKGEEDEKTGPRGPSTSSYDSLVRTQIPDTVRFLEASDAMKAREFTVTLEDGSTRVVSWMPYWRHVKPKAEGATVGQEETVEV